MTKVSVLTTEMIDRLEEAHNKFQTHLDLMKKVKATELESTHLDWAIQFATDKMMEINSILVVGEEPTTIDSYILRYRYDRNEESSPLLEDASFERLIKQLWRRLWK